MNHFDGQPISCWRGAVEDKSEKQWFSEKNKRNWFCRVNLKENGKAPKNKGKCSGSGCGMVHKKKI